MTKTTSITIIIAVIVLCLTVLAHDAMQLYAQWKAEQKRKNVLDVAGSALSKLAESVGNAMKSKTSPQVKRGLNPVPTSSTNHLAARYPNAWAMVFHLEQLQRENLTYVLGVEDEAAMQLAESHAHQILAENAKRTTPRNTPTLLKKAA